MEEKLTEKGENIGGSGSCPNYFCKSCFDSHDMPLLEEDVSVLSFCALKAELCS